MSCRNVLYILKWNDDWGLAGLGQVSWWKRAATCEKDRDLQIAVESKGMLGREIAVSKEYSVKIFHKRLKACRGEWWENWLEQKVRVRGWRDYFQSHGSQPPLVKAGWQCIFLLGYLLKSLKKMLLPSSFSLFGLL